MMRSRDSQVRGREKKGLRRKVTTEEEGLHAKEVGGLGKAKMGERKARGWDEDGQRRENLLSRKEVRR